MRYWDLLTDWVDVTVFKITTVEITRLNVFVTVVVFIATALWGWYAGSVRTFLLLFGGYFLGSLVAFMIREQRGEG